MMLASELSEMLEMMVSEDMMTRTMSRKVIMAKMLDFAGTDPIRESNIAGKKIKA